MTEQNETKTNKAKERRMELRALRDRRDKLAEEIGQNVLEFDLTDVGDVLAGIKDEIEKVNLQIERLESRPHPGITESAEDRDHFDFRREYRDGGRADGAGEYGCGVWFIQAGARASADDDVNVDGTITIGGDRETGRRLAYKAANALASALAAAAAELPPEQDTGQDDG